MRDEADLLERLVDLYTDTGRKEEAEAVRGRLEEARGRGRLPPALDFDDQHEHDRIEPVRRGPKVGRNEPCPCGSGKKYKKCCGR